MRACAAMAAAMALAGALALAAGSCASLRGAYTCTGDSECVHQGTRGSCEPTGYCSFPDGTCPSSRRYGTWAGDGLGGTCVATGVVDGGPPDAPSDAAADSAATDAGDAAPGDGTSTDGNAGDGAADAPQTDAQTDAPVCQPPWWDAAWTARRQLTITNNASQTLPVGFQLGTPLDVEGLIGGSAWDQIRVVRRAGSAWSEQTRVLDNPGANAEWIWLKLAASVAPSAADSSFWIYYGNPAAGAAPGDPALVFDFYDPFSGSALSAAWQYKGTPTVSGSEVRLDYDDHIGTTQTWAPGYAVDVRLRITPVSQRFWLGFHVVSGTPTFQDIEPWIIWITRAVGELWPEFTSDGVSVWEGTPHVTLDTGAHFYGVDRFSSRVVYRRENAVAFDHTLSPSFATSLPVRITNETVSGTVYVDMVRVRQTAYPLPTATLGAEETCP
ncbi:MAG: DUF2341 domain-containing protein [Deltaproteobacteria bacterium]|nr:DUF2341 domain-containing protein [Deltaproteobacteria bacterium]